MFMHANTRPTLQGNMQRDVAKMHRLGVLGPDLVLVHMCFTDADEWKMLGDAGGNVSYTPETEYQMGLGWPSATDPKAAGVNMGIGVDITANNSADMFFQLRCMLQVERARLIEEDTRIAFSRTPFDCADALYWGTMGGAVTLGLEHRIGSLTPGKAADIVLLQADDITLTGWNRRNPEATVIQQAGVHNVDTVLIDGVIQKRNGRLVGDAKRACKLQQETTDYVRAQADAQGGFDVPESVVFQRLGYTEGLATKKAPAQAT
jgi:cytosine/adenosine deaminase-related metal-dependent hydrolase